MARILAILGSGRKKGYTARLLDAALEGIAKVAGVQVDFAHLRDFNLRPCISCFACIKNKSHTCILDDDMGKQGRGRLFAKAKRANGLLIADAVHNWGPTAAVRLFIERLYPFVWSGALNGMPFASISSATNQGMQLEARRMLCRWAFGLGLRYQGGLAVHSAYFDKALKDAKMLGKRLARAALRDAEKRRAFKDDKERFLAYDKTPCPILELYLENLGGGKPRWKGSVIEEALRNHTFKNPKAVELLKKAAEEFRKTLRFYRQGKRRQAIIFLVATSAFWTHATWKEFLEAEVIGTEVPSAYRPLPKNEGP